MQLLSLCALVLAANPVLVDGPNDEAPAPSRCAPAIQCTAKVAPGEVLSIELGSDGRGGDGELVHGGQTVVRYAFTERIELHLYTNTLILPGAEPRSHEGLQPGFKVTLLDESDVFPEQVLAAYLTMPTFDPSQTWDFESWWTLSKTFGAFKADLNVMFAVADVAGEQAMRGLAMLTVRTELTRRISLFSEGFGTWGQTQALPPGVGVFSGVSLAASDELVLDVGAEIALHEAQAPMVTVFAGITWSPSGDAHTASPLLARADWP